MIARSYFKQFIVSLMIASSLNQLNAQSLLLRPYYGRKWYNSNSKNIDNANFDPTFSNVINKSRYITGIAFELYYPNKSFELYFSSQPSLLKSQTSYPPAGIAIAYESGDDISQFQLIYNQYIKGKRKNTEKIGFIPLVSIGLGIGIPSSNDLYDKSRFYDSIVLGNEYLALDIRVRKLTKISFSTIFKIGVALCKGKKEYVRIQALANIGWNKYIYNEVRYSHTNQKYSGDIFTRGTYVGIQLSVPLYLKRWHKK